MKFRLALVGLFVFIFLGGCGGFSSPSKATLPPVPSPTLAPPGEQSFQAPDVEEAARAFLEAWKAEDYHSMYT
ncbi:MAG: hypothetical protein P8Y03_31240, partial [Anaerolineales bacterium]